jgi:sporadic carbohydrate cluster protein (TIGR04323 family)
MPVPAQNSCMREYCNQLGWTFVFPLVELFYKNCHSNLFRLLESLPNEAHICCYSILMLPKSDEKFALISKVMQEKGLKFHFVLEKRVANTPEDLLLIYNPYFYGSLISRENDDNLKHIIELSK